MGYDDDLADEARLWDPDLDAVPPVIGRVDPRTRKPVMRYDTDGEVSDPDAKSTNRPDEWYETDDGVNVTISF